MITQVCAICGKNNYRVLYPENFDIKNLDERTFSARRLPDKVHYRIVQCKTCRLVYSNPILPYSRIVALYKKSFTSYDEHIENLKETYGFYLKKLEKFRKGLKISVSNDLSGAQLKRSEDEHAHRSEKRGIENLFLLEIGCGNGFFLEEALKQGYGQVYGVEPGKKSVEKANSKIKKNIVVDIFRPGLFKKNFFDVVCCFQTLDHIPDPNSFLQECFAVLKKGGLVLFLNHDVSSLSARILREGSPIIDIEHTYLFDKKTMTQIFKKHRFKILEVSDATNIHHLSHWIHLFPFPRLIKILLSRFLEFTHLGKIKIKLNPGNVVLIAKK